MAIFDVVTPLELFLNYRRTTMRENLIMLHTNSKDAVQPAHPLSLINIPAELFLNYRRTTMRENLIMLHTNSKDPVQRAHRSV